jgi:hypothetical protein
LVFANFLSPRVLLALDRTPNFRNHSAIALETESLSGQILSRYMRPHEEGTGLSAATVSSRKTSGESDLGAAVLRKKSVNREFIVANSQETHSCSSQHTRGMLPAP